MWDLRIRFEIPVICWAVWQPQSVCPRFALFCIAPNASKASLKCTWEKAIDSVSSAGRLHLKTFYLWALPGIEMGLPKQAGPPCWNWCCDSEEGSRAFISPARKSPSSKPSDSRWELVCTNNLLFFSKPEASLGNSGHWWISRVFLLCFLHC